MRFKTNREKINEYNEPKIKFAYLPTSVCNKIITKDMPEEIIEMNEQFVWLETYLQKGFAYYSVLFDEITYNNMKYLDTPENRRKLGLE